MLVILLNVMNVFESFVYVKLNLCYCKIKIICLFCIKIFVFCGFIVVRDDILVLKYKILYN